MTSMMVDEAPVLSSTVLAAPQKPEPPRVAPIADSSVATKIPGLDTSKLGSLGSKEDCAKVIQKFSSELKSWAHLPQDTRDKIVKELQVTFGVKISIPCSLAVDAVGSTLIRLQGINGDCYGMAEIKTKDIKAVNTEELSHMRFVPAHKYSFFNENRAAIVSAFEQNHIKGYDSITSRQAEALKRQLSQILGLSNKEGEQLLITKETFSNGAEKKTWEGLSIAVKEGKNITEILYIPSTKTLEPFVYTKKSHVNSNQVPHDLNSPDPKF